MSKSRKKITSLVVAVMYALCILVAAPVQAYAYVPDTHAVAKKYTKSQKAAQTTKALKALAKLPKSTTAAKAYDNAYEYTLLISRYNDAANQVLRAKNMGVNYKGLKNYARLAIAKARINVLRAVITTITPVIALINALPDTITIANTAQVNAANDAFNDLTAAEQKLVSNKGALTEAVADLAALSNTDVADAAAVVTLIAALPVPATLASETNVIAARTAYTALTVAGKALVTNLAVLVTAEAKIVELNGVFTVSSVTAPNTKQILVTFNKAVDETTAETVANYSVYDNGSTTVFGVNPLIATLQDDGKSVMLLLDAIALGKLTNPSNAKVIVNKAITDTNAVALAADYTTLTVAVSDTAAPTVVRTSQTAPNKLKVYFNEPVYDLSGSLTIGSDNFKIDNGSYLITGASVLDYDTYAIELTISGNFTNGAHTLTVNPVAASDILDFAGFEVALAADTAFTIAADVTAPTATIKTITQTSVTFLFSEAVTNAQNANIAYRHSVNSTAYQVLGNTADVTINTAGTEVTVNFAAAGFPIPIGTATLYISYISDTGTKMLDAFANEFVATSLTGTVAADTTKPTVTAAMVSGSNTQINVTASETVTGGTTAANYVLKDSDGDIVAQTSVTNPSTNVYRLTYPALSGTYTLTVSNLKDTAVIVNTMVSVILPITVADTIVPFLTLENGTTAGTTVFQQADAKNVRIYFSEAMNATDLVTLTNYQNVSDSSANPTAAVAATNGKSVFLTFAAVVVNAQGVVVGQLKDLAGNKITSLATIMPTLTGNTPVGFSTTADYTAIATSPTTVKLYLNDVISALSAADFEVDDTTAYTLNDGVNGTVTTALENGETVLSIILSDTDKIAKAQWDTAAPVVGTVSTPHNQGTTTTTANAFGAKVNLAVTNIVDGIAPELATTDAIKALDADGNGKVDHIKVTFTEFINNIYVSPDKFTVAGYTVTDAFAASAAVISATARPGAGVANATTVYVTVTEKATTDLTATPAITIATGLKDVAGNAFVAGTIPATVALGGGTGVTGANVITQGVAAVAQVETATVVGDVGVAGVGNYDVVVTGAGITGSPLLTAVAVANGDTATQIAVKIRAALPAAVTSLYTVGGSGAVVTLTKTAAVANDATLNISLFPASSTATGTMTVIPTSVNTTAGVLGVTEKATLTVTGATAAGNVVVTIGGVVQYVPVLATDTATLVAGKIAAAVTATGYTVTNSTTTVVFTSTTANTPITDLIVTVQ